MEHYAQLSADPAVPSLDRLGLTRQVSLWGAFPPREGESVVDGFVGDVREFAGFYAPSGTLLCDGKEYKASEHPKLFSIIGNKFGGDGATTFRVPDLRARFPIGTGPEGLGGVRQFLKTAGTPSKSFVGSVSTTWVILDDGKNPASAETECLLGEIRWFAGKSLPAIGWAPADGRHIDSTTLWGLFTNTFGGKDSKDFKLPNLMGRTAALYGTSRDGTTLAFAKTAPTPLQPGAVGEAGPAGVGLVPLVCIKGVWPVRD